MTPRALILGVLVIVLSACSSAPLRELIQPSKGAATLATGLRQYDDGEYPEAARNVEAAIDLGLSDRERANAHKTLAFIHCASARERACREEFRKALSINPDLELTPAEAGHPAWGPIFASLKAGPAPFKLALQQYEAGQYAESAKNFQGAIREGLSAKELANAHKHLAFIYCVSNRERQCRDEFKKALGVDPTLELEPAEAGHPVWGPVFRSVKAGSG
jgi:Tfp pilus assembly protein PilF